MKERSYALLMGSVSSLLTKINIMLILQGPCFVKSIFKVSSFHSDLEMYKPWKKIPNKKIMLYAFFYICKTQFSNINDFAYSNDTCEVPKFVFILKYFWIEVSFHIQSKPFFLSFSATPYTSPIEALHFLEGHAQEVDVAFVALHMEEIHGFQFLDIVREAYSSDQ